MAKIRDGRDKLDPSINDFRDGEKCALVAATRRSHLGAMRYVLAIAYAMV